MFKLSINVLEHCFVYNMASVSHNGYGQPGMAAEWQYTCPDIELHDTSIRTALPGGFTVQELIEALHTVSKLYEDPEFPGSSQSISYSGATLAHITWARPPVSVFFFCIICTQSRHEYQISKKRESASY